MSATESQINQTFEQLDWVNRIHVGNANFAI
jgi:hypothetical protein